jgi:hypothetical protein
MDQVLKMQWVDALRSGKYHQHQHSMNNAPTTKDIPTAFCCLGVLANEMGDPHMMMDYDQLGIPEDQVDKLIVMNDGEFKGMIGRKHSFTEIADYIEKNL